MGCREPVGCMGDCEARSGHVQLCTQVFSWCFFFSSRRRHTRYIGDWSSDVCSSDLSRGEGQHVDQLAQLLQLLLVLHPESLLLIDDYEPQVLERHVLREQPMGADQDVDLDRKSVV